MLRVITHTEFDLLVNGVRVELILKRLSYWTIGASSPSRLTQSRSAHEPPAIQKLIKPPGGLRSEE